MTGPYWLVFDRPELANLDLMHTFRIRAMKYFWVGVHFEITPSKPKELFRNKVEHHHESEDEGGMQVNHDHCS